MASVVPFVADTSGPFSQLLATEHAAQTVQTWIQSKKDAISTIKRQALDRNAPFSAIYERIKQLEGDIGRFKRLLQSNEALRADWRQVHMAAWRGTIRPLKVTDLPNEILTTVFANLQDDAVPEIRAKGVTPHDVLPSPGVTSIRNVRLTCRAFCGPGSRFLLPVVNISFTAASLQRLQDVSSHSTISKGVRTLRLHGNPYDASSANDGAIFREEMRYKVCYILERVEGSLRTAQSQADADRRLQGLPREPYPSFLSMGEFEVAWVQTRRVLIVMTKMAQQESRPLSPFERKIKGLIEQAHAECARRYQEQQGLLQDDQMLANIATAVRKMPSVQRLCLPGLGWDRMFRSGWDNRYDIQKFKCRNMDSNFFLDYLNHNGDEQSPLRSSSTLPLLHKLPLVFHAANQNLTDLEIDLPLIREREMGNLVTIIPDLQRSCRKLKYARITIAEYHRTTHDPVQTLAATYSILKPMLCSPTLESVKLYYTRRDDPHNLIDKATSIGPVLENLPWDTLRSVCLKDFSLRPGELRHFLGKVPGKIHMELDGIFLMDGTWEEVLEILRGRVDHSSRVVGPRGAQLDSMSGRQAWELRREFDSEQRGRWYSFQRCPGPASFYIRGGNIRNPLTLFDE